MPGPCTQVLMLLDADFVPSPTMVPGYQSKEVGRKWAGGGGCTWPLGRVLRVSTGARWWSFTWRTAHHHQALAAFPRCASVRLTECRITRMAKFGKAVVGTP